MDFKALSRTAEADVQAFASAARQRLVWNPVVSVGLAENYRFMSCLRLTPQVVDLRTPAKELFSVLHRPVSTFSSQPETERSPRVCRRTCVPWISEGAKGSRLGMTLVESNQERSDVPPPLKGDQQPRLPERTELPDYSHRKNPRGIPGITPFPTTADTGRAPRLQLPTHAIHPATGHLSQ